jgi:hypothetical protein
MPRLLLNEITALSIQTIPVCLFRFLKEISGAWLAIALVGSKLGAYALISHIIRIAFAGLLRSRNNFTAYLRCMEINTKQMPPKTKRNGAATAHTRSEVRQKRGKGNVAAEAERLRIEVDTRLRVAFRAFIGSGFAFAAT